MGGWTDGKVRAFYPGSGRLKFVINDAHAEAVTALATCSDDETRPPWRIVTGGRRASAGVERDPVAPCHGALAQGAPRPNGQE